jgi:hypothetical protein
MPSPGGWRGAIATGGGPIPEEARSPVPVRLMPMWWAFQGWPEVRAYELRVAESGLRVKCGFRRSDVNSTEGTFSHDRKSGKGGQRLRPMADLRNMGFRPALCNQLIRQQLISNQPEMPTLLFAKRNSRRIHRVSPDPAIKNSPGKSCEAPLLETPSSSASGPCNVRCPRLHTLLRPKAFPSGDGRPPHFAPARLSCWKWL